MGNDWENWIKILIFALLFLAPVIRWIFQALTGPRQQERPVRGQPPARKRGIHDVLDEIRREADGHGRKEVDGDPAFPAPDVVARDVVAREGQKVAGKPEIREVRPGAQQVRPLRREVPRQPPARPLAQDETSRGLGVELTPLDHLPDRSFEGLTPSEQGSRPLQKARTALPSRGPSHLREAPPPESFEKTRRAPTLLGMDMRQLIVAQIILGPPKALQHRGAARPAQPPVIRQGMSESQETPVTDS